MTHTARYFLLLLIVGAPVTVLAECRLYPNSEHGLSLPDTITVPASLPVGSLIIRQAFNGIAPSFELNCRTSTPRQIIGRFTDSAMVPGAGVTAYHTGVPGVGIRVLVRNHRGLVYPHQLHTSPPFSQSNALPLYSNVSAEALFFKTGPVTSGTLTSGSLVEDRWDGGKGRFHLLLNTSVRFVAPTPTCNLDAGDVNRTILFEPVQVRAFDTQTVVGGRDFELTAQCSDAMNVTFRFSGAPAPGNDRIFANTGTAAGVALWLYSRLGGGVQNILANGTENTRTLAVSGNRAVLPLGSAYHKNGTVTQGTFISTVTVHITYD